MTDSEFKEAIEKIMKFYNIPKEHVVMSYEDLTEILLRKRSSTSS